MSWSTWTKAQGTDDLRSGLSGPRAPFADRADAGRQLGQLLVRTADLASPVVVALPRGGVPIGAAVAHLLQAPLVVMPVSKVGAPGREELAIGAVAPGGSRVLNQEVIEFLDLGSEMVDKLVARALAKLSCQIAKYRWAAHTPLLERSAIVVDDGLATGATMWAALMSVREQRPRRVVLAVPVAPPEALRALAPLVDEEVCVFQPPHMQAVGAWYEDFAQTTDEDVAEIVKGLGQPG